MQSGSRPTCRRGVFRLPMQRYVLTTMIGERYKGMVITDQGVRALGYTNWQQ